MQKKKEEISEFKLFVSMIFKATNEPNKYEPESPKKILAFGKLKSKNDSKITIWPAIMIAKFSWLFSKFTNKSIIFIISMCIAKRPLKPSIRFDPLTIKRKHNNTKIIEKISFLSHEFKKFKSIEVIFIEK